MNFLNFSLENLRINFETDIEKYKIKINESIRKINQII